MTIPLLLIQSSMNRKPFCWSQQKGQNYADYVGTRRKRMNRNFYIHIRRDALYQPLTRYEDKHCINPGHVFTNDSDKIFRCFDCLDERKAADLEIRIDYDSIHIRCSDECYTGARRARIAKEKKNEPN